MQSIKRLSKKFGRQSLNEVKPAPPSSTVDHTTAPPTVTTPHTSPLFTKDLPRRCSDHTSSDSSDSESEEDCTTRAHPVHSVIRKKHLGSNKLKMERVSSAEKRTYRQYKYSTGSSSSASSSDDEIKEAFEGHTHFHYSPVMKTSLKDFKQGSPLSWGTDPLFANRPLKALPVGHRKPKYFAQMSGSYAERPRLDFNKMQHSKRLVMVRRPLVLRNNSKVHSIARPPSFAVSLDISAHTFTPVLTQT
ncbi:uncharacterized protein LOC135349209 [Halichondria panicea]|uniref:uncharacterized protein LOC135349209 n=1 Tax=Halichondria panicea TaxID=6063 RepID=UPI00312B64D5